jgi:hypothetical protein
LDSALQYLASAAEETPRSRREQKTARALLTWLWGQAGLDWGLLVLLKKERIPDTPAQLRCDKKNAENQCDIRG